MYEWYVSKFVSVFILKRTAPNQFNVRVVVMGGGAIKDYSAVMSVFVEIEQNNLMIFFLCTNYSLRMLDVHLLHKISITDCNCTSLFCHMYNGVVPFLDFMKNFG